MTIVFTVDWFKTSMFSLNLEMMRFNFSPSYLPIYNISLSHHQRLPKSALKVQFASAVCVARSKAKNIGLRIYIPTVLRDICMDY